MPELAGVTAALAALGIRVAPGSAQAVGGGCIHGAHRLAGPDGPVFLKTNREDAAWMLAAEVDGLDALHTAGCLRVPAVLGHGTVDGIAWLALEWLDLRPASTASDGHLGTALARQHLAGGGYFGWRQDNAIGATAQCNSRSDDWGRFFATRRIAFQLEIGARRGLPKRLLQRGELLVELVPVMLADRRPSPALLHGDLWSGNRAANPQGKPVVFDPAAHFGDPECDLAMTRLFGGFNASFYAAYDAVIPPVPGRARRESLYQLYHVLNHANLFGGGYVGQAERIVERLLAEAG